MSGLTVHRRWEYETARKRTRMLRLRKLSRVQNFKIIAASGLIKGAVRRTNYKTDFSVLFPIAFNPNNNTVHKKTLFTATVAIMYKTSEILHKKTIHSR